MKPSIPMKTIEVSPVRPSAAIRAKYREAIQRELRALQDAINYFVVNTYKREIATDASGATELRKALRKLSRRWNRNFNQLAPQLAEYFSKRAFARVNGDLEKKLRRAGLTVEFKTTAAQNEALQAVIGEQVGLIKSIASQHLAQVEQLVLRSAAVGRDLGYLTTELEKRYQLTKKRASFIARHQNNQATAVFTKARQIELGQTIARWRHSAGGAFPRPEHVAMDGKFYDIRTGAFLEGKYTWPGVEPNCRCVSITVINLE